MVAEHIRPEGLAQGYYCLRCGAGGVNMYATGHGPGKCDNNPQLVEELKLLNRQTAAQYQSEDDLRREQMRAVQRPRVYDQTQSEPYGKPTSGGRWIKRDVDVHRCPKPMLKRDAPGVAIGDKWECNNCHTIWKVKGFDSGMQWDPYTTAIKWEKQAPQIGVTSWRDR